MISSTEFSDVDDSELEAQLEVTLLFYLLL